MPNETGWAVSRPGSTARRGDDRRLSIIVPCFNEARNLPALHGRLVALAQKLRAERHISVDVVYIDDGSRDDTYAVACRLPATGLDFQALSLSRNFGKEAALTAGLHHAGDGALLFMDGDGQHSPELVERLVSHWLDDGYDVVYTAKAHRKAEPVSHRLMAKVFYTLINFRARYKLPADAGDFRLLSPRAAHALRQMPERNRFFKGMASWIGFRQKRVEYEPAAREHGASNWNVASLIGLSIEGMTSFSIAPLRVASFLGMMLATVALIFGASILYETLVYGESVPGYPSVVVGLMVLGGVQLIMIGVMGEYIGKILSEQKARPVYFVADHHASNAGEDERRDDAHDDADRSVVRPRAAE